MLIGRQQSYAETIMSIAYLQAAFRCTCQSSRPRARLQLEGFIKVMLAIGINLNFPDLAGKKAFRLPAQQARFLGFVVDESQQCFFLPEEKSQDRSLRSMLQTFSAALR